MTPEQSAANYVAKVLAEAPPLTVFQRERIATILRVGADEPQLVHVQAPEAT